MNEISVPIFKTGGLNVTGLSLIDYNNKVIKKVIVEWNKFLTSQRHVTSSEMEYDVHTAIPVRNGVLAEEMRYEQPLIILTSSYQYSTLIFSLSPLDQFTIEG